MECKFFHFLRSQVRYCCTVNMPAYGVNSIRWAACPLIVSKTLWYFLSLLYIWISINCSGEALALAQLFNDLLEGRGERTHLLRTQVDFLEKEQQGTPWTEMPHILGTIYSPPRSLEKRNPNALPESEERECQNSQSLLVLLLLESTSIFTTNHWVMKMEFAHFFSQYYGM